MTKFIFDRKKLLDLLENSKIIGDYVVVDLSFKCDVEVDGVFPAKVAASVSKGDTDVLGTMKAGEVEVLGCPSPPGCTTELIRNKLDLM